MSVVVPLAEQLDAGWSGWTVTDAANAEVRIAASTRVPDTSLDRLARQGCIVRRRDAPRGARLLEAARESRGRILVFLHADTELPSGWFAAILRALSGRRPWGAFRLGFAGPSRRRRLSVVALGANLRSRLCGLPFGDQAPFVTRDAYDAVGGHPPWPFLDDLELDLRLRRLARPVLIPAPVRTSPRRYLEHGVLHTIWTNARILSRFAHGVSPDELETVYRHG